MKGLHRQGLHGLARRVGVRLLNAVNVAGANVELLYVSPDGRVHYDFADRDPLTAAPAEIAATTVPEAPQAWTVTAALALKWSGRWPAGGAVTRARAALDAEVLREVPEVHALRTSAELGAAYERRGDFVLNRALASERDRAARAGRC